MKKLLLTLALTALATATYGAAGAAVNLNNFDPDKPIYIGSEGTLAANDAAGNIYLAFMGGPQGGPLAPMTASDGVSVFELAFDGYFDGGFGAVPGAAPNAQVDLKIQVWKGAPGSDYASAAAALMPVYEATWTQASGSWDPGPPPGTPSGLPNGLSVPGTVVMTVVPEPSTIALGLLGAAALFIRRRK